MNVRTWKLIPRLSQAVGALILATWLFPCPQAALGDEDVYLLDVPDYQWHAGCFGTATGNLMGYWDRNGFTNFYTGPTGGGVAPLNAVGPNASIRGMWASQAGVDGRPFNNPGHMDDYYVDYESTANDPYVTFGRVEHTPDCIGDFIGLNQRKWTNMNAECDGNIDAFSFVYWDGTGQRRTNYTPPGNAGGPPVDIQSGLRAWARWRDHEVDVFTQLTDFNPLVPAGQGFTFEDLKREIRNGYPVMVFLQDFYANSRGVAKPNLIPRANPNIHGMLIYGYQEGIDELGLYQIARYRTSWASGDHYASYWSSAIWQAGMPVRGVIGVHPRPKITSIEITNGMIQLAWDGPSARLRNALNGTTSPVHRYVVQRSSSLTNPKFGAITEPSTNRFASVPVCCGDTSFFQVILLENP